MPDRSNVPEFAVVLRGYHREQVEDFVSRLLSDLDEMRSRAVVAEQRPAPQLRAPTPAQPTHGEPAAEPTSAGFAELGNHVAAVLQHATDEARALRASAERDREQAASEAQAVVAEARRRADELLQRAQSHADRRAEEVVGAALGEADALRGELESLREQHRQALERVRELAVHLLAVTGDGPARPADEEPTRTIDLRPAEVAG